MIFEILQEYFPTMIQKADMAIDFDESFDDTTMDDDGFELSDNDDPIKIENVRSDHAAFESNVNVQIAEPSNEKKVANNINENDLSVQYNGQTNSHAVVDHTIMDAMKMEMIEMQNYKMKLELIKMERELYLKPSKYTEEIVMKQSL